jgi:hypothetical protein
MKWTYFPSSIVEVEGLNGYEDFSNVETGFIGVVGDLKVPGFATPLNHYFNIEGNIAGYSQYSIASDTLGRHLRCGGFWGIDEYNNLSALTIPLKPSEVDTWKKLRIGFCFTASDDFSYELTSFDINLFGVGFINNEYYTFSGSAGRQFSGAVFINTAVVRSGSTSDVREWRTSYYSSGGLGKAVWSHGASGSEGIVQQVTDTNTKYLFGYEDGNLRDFYVDIDRTSIGQMDYNVFCGSSTAAEGCDLDEFKTRMRYDWLDLDSQGIAGMSYSQVAGYGMVSNPQLCLITRGRVFNVEAIAYKIFE